MHIMNSGSHMTWVWLGWLLLIFAIVWLGWFFLRTGRSRPQVSQDKGDLIQPEDSHPANEIDLDEYKSTSMEKR